MRHANRRRLCLSGLLLVTAGILILYFRISDDSKVKAVHEDKQPTELASDKLPLSRKSDHPVHKPDPSSSPATIKTIDSQQNAPLGETEWRSLAEKRESNQHRRVTLSRIQKTVENLVLHSGQKIRLESLLMDKEFLRVDMIKAAQLSGSNTKSEAFDILYNNSLQSIEAEIEGLLGTQMYKKLQESTAAVSQDRFYALEFLGEAYEKGVGLTASQRQKFNELLSEMDAANGNLVAWRRSPVNATTGLSLYDERVLTEAEGILTKQQIATLSAVRREVNLFDQMDSSRKRAKQTKVKN